MLNLVKWPKKDRSRFEGIIGRFFVSSVSEALDAGHPTESMDKIRIDISEFIEQEVLLDASAYPQHFTAIDIIGEQRKRLHTAVELSGENAGGRH